MKNGLRLGRIAGLPVAAHRSVLVVRRALRGVRVGDVMRRQPCTVSSEMSVAELVDHHLFGHPQAAFPVAAPDGEIVGLVTRGQVGDLMSARRCQAPVATVAVPLDEVPAAAPNELLITVLKRVDRLARDPTGGRILVFQDGDLVGLVTPSDVHGIVDARTQEVPS